MNFKERFFKLASNIPDLSDNSYFFFSFFYNWYGKKFPLRIGCWYSDKSIEMLEDPSVTNNSNFFFLCEDFKQLSKPNFSDSISRKFDNQKFYFDYVPNQGFIKGLIEPNRFHVSWENKDKVFTVIDKLSHITEFNDSEINIQKFKKNREMRNFIKILSKKQSKTTYPELFDLLNYLPDQVDDWELVTIPFLDFQTVQVLDEKHSFKIVQANYKKSDRYLNVGLTFGCNCPNSEIENILERPKFLGRDFSKIKINNKEVSKRKEDLFIKLIYLNRKKRYSISVFNNETSINRKKHKDVMRRLMSKTMNKLNNYKI